MAGPAHRVGTLTAGINAHKLHDVGVYQVLAVGFAPSRHEGEWVGAVHFYAMCMN